MKVYFISFLLPLLSFGCILCGIVPEEIVHKKGGYTQWREKLGFLPCEPVPDCHVKCQERCGPDHKGVSICASLEEKVDYIPDCVDAESSNSSTSQVRGHSTTTWTKFCHFLAPPPSCQDTFYTLSVDKNRCFLTPPPILST